jgi:hypothetical protein
MARKEAYNYNCSICPGKRGLISERVVKQESKISALKEETRLGIRLVQASLTPEQRKDLQFSLQVILSRTLYETTVKSPSTPPSPRSNRRSTLNLVSPKLELDEETQKWLAHEYRLGEGMVPWLKFQAESRKLMASLLFRLLVNGAFSLGMMSVDEVWRRRARMCRLVSGLSVGIGQCCR